MYRLNQARMKTLQAEISDYVSVANRISDAIYRGIDLTKRIADQYKMADTIPAEVVDYITEYEGICGAFCGESIKIEPANESAILIITAIVSGLWKLLLRLYESIKHALRWLLNEQYRASAQAIKYRQKICLMKTSSNAVSKFGRYVTGMTVRPEDFKLVCQSTKNIIGLLIQVSDQKSAASIDSLLGIQAPMCGFAYSEDHLVDTIKDIEVISGAYADIGWTADACDNMAKMLMDCTGMAVRLKNIQSKLDSDISELRRKMNSKIANGADSSSLEDVQKELTLKTKAYNVIKDGLEVISTRSTFMDRIIGKIASDATAITEGRDPDSDDDDFSW